MNARFHYASVLLLALLFAACALGQTYTYEYLNPPSSGSITSVLSYYNSQGARGLRAFTPYIESFTPQYMWFRENPQKTYTYRTWRYPSATPTSRDIANAISQEWAAGYEPAAVYTEFSSSTPPVITPYGISVSPAVDPSVSSKRLEVLTALSQETVAGARTELTQRAEQGYRLFLQSFGINGSDTNAVFMRDLVLVPYDVILDQLPSSVTEAQSLFATRGAAGYELGTTVITSRSATLGMLFYRKRGSSAAVPYELVARSRTERASDFLAIANSAGARGLLYAQDIQAPDSNNLVHVFMKRSVGGSGGSGTGGTAPVVSTPPASASVTVGQPARFAVDVGGATGVTFQWRKNGTAIPGATSAVFSIASVTTSDAGTYDVVVTNAAGSTISAGGILTVSSLTTAARLINLSILTSLDSPNDSFTMGYVVGGAGTSGNKPLVIRAAGPSLAALGVAGTLPDPRIEFYAGSSKTGENDNWGGGADIASAMASVGAFAYAGPASRDAAVFTSVSAGDNSVKVSATGSGTGSVIAEIYDATPPANFTSSTPRLVNVSVLKHIGTGLTAGFVIGGASSKTVLIRAIGPTLGAAPFNVSGVLADPQLVLFAGADKVGENDNWSGTGPLTNAFTSVGAFSLPASSRDAALLATLQPGNYSVQVSGVGATSGVALIEIYEVP